MTLWKNPKKLEISDFPTNLPIPGSLGLLLKILTNKNKEKLKNNIPRKIFNSNNLKLP